jgi:hypothetical protein
MVSTMDVPQEAVDCVSQGGFEFVIVSRMSRKKRSYIAKGWLF